MYLSDKNIALCGIILSDRRAIRNMWDNILAVGEICNIKKKKEEFILITENMTKCIKVVEDEYSLKKKQLTIMLYQ